MTGKFNFHSTATEVLRGVDLTGKLAVVTGGAGGLGKETARALAAAGANIVIGSRSARACAALCSEWAAAMPRSSFDSFPLDLSEVAGAEAFADFVLSLGRSVDIFIGNAGVMATPLTRNSLAHEIQFATNYIGHAVLISRISPLLRRSGNARVVVLSSSAHHYGPPDIRDLNWETRPYDKWLAYGQSKTACSLLAVKIGLAMKDSGVTALAVHPGVISTDLARYLSTEDYDELMKRTDVPQPAFRERKSVEQGAATSVWAATASELAGQTAYLEDCTVARRITVPDTVSGVFDYALDADRANELWTRTEQLLGRTLPL